jgi:hypothetical protein
MRASAGRAVFDRLVDDVHAVDNANRDFGQSAGEILEEAAETDRGEDERSESEQILLPTSA